MRHIIRRKHIAPCPDPFKDLREHLFWCRLNTVFPPAISIRAKQRSGHCKGIVQIRDFDVVDGAACCFDPSHFTFVFRLVIFCRFKIVLEVA